MSPIELEVLTDRITGMSKEEKLLAYQLLKKEVRIIKKNEKEVPSEK